MPSEEEIIESADCQQCRAYFNKTGPVCAHCRLYNQAIRPYKYTYLTAARRHNTRLVQGTKSHAHHNPQQQAASVAGASSMRIGSVADLFLNADEMEVRQFDEGMVDGPFVMVIKLLRNFSLRYRIQDYIDVSKAAVQWLELLVSEVDAMISLWDRYSELLKTHDEITQCRSRVQLSNAEYASEDRQGVEVFTAEEVEPAFQETWMQAISAEKDLQTGISSMRFFKRQVQLENHEKIDLEHHEHCGICQEALFGSIDPKTGLEDEVIMLPCAHRFHSECAHHWVALHKRCPYCRAAVDLQLIAKVIADGKSDQMQQQKMLKKRGEDCKLIRIPNNNPTAAEEINDVHFSNALKKLKGKWGTKVDAVVADLIALHDDIDRFDEKFIVFSQWIEVRPTRVYRGETFKELMRFQYAVDVGDRR